MFALWWCFAGILPLVFARYEPVSAGTMAWVILSSIVVSAGAWIGNGGFKTRHTPQHIEAGLTERQLLSAVLLVSVVLGLASSAVFAVKSGVSLADVLDLQRLVVLSNQLYVARYAETGAPPAPPLLSQVLLPFVYLAPIVGGLVYVFRRRWTWRLLALLSLLPAIAVTVLQTTKAAILFSASFWLASYFAARLRTGELRVFTRGHLVVGAVLGVVVTVFFFAVGLARLASTDTSLLSVVFLKLATAAFGHMSVFSQWLGQYWNDPFHPTLGAYTFSGPLELMGFSQRIPGIFENVIELVAGESSNIYTGFRPLIQDFTMPGAIVILLVLGVVSGIAFRRVAAGRWAAAPVLVAAYVTILWTPITWFWIYNSLTATVVGLAGLVWLIRLVRGKIGHVATVTA